MIFFSQSKETHDNTGRFLVSNNHDWYDDYKAYTRINAGRTGGSDAWGCLLLMLEAAGGTIVMMAIIYFFGSLFGAI